MSPQIKETRIHHIDLTISWYKVLCSPSPLCLFQMSSGLAKRSVVQKNQGWYGCCVPNPHPDGLSQSVLLGSLTPTQLCSRKKNKLLCNSSLCWSVYQALEHVLWMSQGLDSKDIHYLLASSWLPPASSQLVPINSTVSCHLGEVPTRNKVYPSGLKLIS